MLMQQDNSDLSRRVTAELLRIHEEERMRCYLLLQGRFLTESVGNTLLIMNAAVGATEVKTAAAWMEENNMVVRTNRPIRLLRTEEFVNQKGSIETYDKVETVYERSDTRYPEDLRMSYNRGLLLSAIIEICEEARIRVYHRQTPIPYSEYDLTLHALYDPQEKAIMEYSDKNANRDRVVAQFLKEMVLAFLHRSQSRYNRMQLSQEANMITRILCSALGIPQELPEELQYVSAEFPQPTDKRHAMLIQIRRKAVDFAEKIKERYWRMLFADTEGGGSE